MSYECRIKMESQNLACKRFWLYFLFYKNANDTEIRVRCVYAPRGIEVNVCMALMAWEWREASHARI